MTRRIVAGMMLSWFSQVCMAEVQSQDAAVLVPLQGVTGQIKAAERNSALVGPQATASRDVRNSREQAAQWGLTEQEWSQYQALMAGQRGIWSPGLDPLTALGVEARTDDERRHYAELAARLEFERVERELAYERERMAAFKRLYPDVRAVEYSPQARGTDLLKSPGDKRLILFADKRCEDCAARVARLVEHASADVTLDIYVVGLEGNDEVLRQWATAHQLPLPALQTGRITLNHEAGAMRRLQLEAALPQVLIRTADGRLSPFRA